METSDSITAFNRRKIASVNDATAFSSHKVAQIDAGISRIMLNDIVAQSKPPTLDLSRRTSPMVYEVQTAEVPTDVGHALQSTSSLHTLHVRIMQEFR